ncbi:MAG TPA: beta-N-acetylhexosaminidase [Candidatus Binatia bacterium]|jgi:beta-N-acetylhexosaminidase|nr:beta-N-acetylhexosaminidase [Candidatus Binatia bacterium]
MPAHSTIGQLFMVGIPHPTLDSHTRQLLRELQPAGVILFRRNYRDPETLAAFCTEVRSLFPDHLLLIALDHEGGRVHRLDPPFTHFPPAAALGRIGSAALAQRVGLAMGRELSSIGIDINFAPVLDVLTNPHNTVIGDRAFAADPQVVGLLGCALMRGLREGGVVPCGKHFPGHGATLIDSHDDLPRDERGEEEFMRIDLPPFRRVIAEGAEIVMTAHVQYPALDPNLPATLSPLIIDGLLRRRLGFQGVVVTDDLEMGAIVRHSTVEQAAVGALCAGADLLLMCHSLERARAARDACVRALGSGTLSAQRIEQAGQRIAALRQTPRQRQPRTTTLIGTPEHQQLVEEILQQAS